jgi:hypothetical protein
MTGATDAELSSRAGLGTSNQTDPPAVDVERQPMPDTASETTSDTSTQPPARSGPAANAPEQPDPLHRMVITHITLDGSLLKSHSIESEDTAHLIQLNPM